MLSIDAAKTRVILVGTSECTDDPANFPELPEVKVNLQALRTLLTDSSLVGVPAGNVFTFLNEQYVQDLAAKLWKAAAAEADTFILYYAGHGTVAEESSELLLALKGTTFEARDANALPSFALRRAIRNSPASKKILIIDSCFSGRAIPVLAPQADYLRIKIEVTGTFAIASAPPNDLARSRGVDGCTAFTGELVRVLRAGVPNDQPVLTLDTIYRAVKAKLGEGYPEPQKANWQDADQMAIAVNRGYKPQIASASGVLSPSVATGQGKQRRVTFLGGAVMVLAAAMPLLLLFAITRPVRDVPDDPPATPPSAVHPAPAAKDEVTISGSVLTPAGVPIPGARVTVLTKKGGVLRTDVTDRGGKYRITLQKGVTFSIMVYHTGYPPRVIEGLVAARDQMLDLNFLNKASPE